MTVGVKDKKTGVRYLINRQIGIVKEIVLADQNFLDIVVLVGEKTLKAYAYPEITGELFVGDKVLLNTTAVDLSLGSGGYHFVMATLESPRMTNDSTQKKSGHIMKLRYTPFQVKVLAVEEEDSPWHDLMDTDEELSGTPVIAGSLHSMLIPCICGIKAVKANLRAAYVMTDGGALPIGFSKAVRALKEAGLMCGTVTIGHAYGGDYEAVNLFSGILAAKKVLQAQVIVVLMGPGIVGTGTRWGNTGLEVGQIINAIFTLGGKSFMIPRLSFAEQRNRHWGLSHHTLTVLRKVALAPTYLVLPELNKQQKKIILDQLQAQRPEKYNLVWDIGEEGIKLAKELKLPLSHMGRSYEEDPAFFLAASAAGKAAANSAFF